MLGYWGRRDPFRGLWRIGFKVIRGKAGGGFEVRVMGENGSIVGSVVNRL